MRLRHPQRLIEIDVPIRQISAHARRKRLGAPWIAGQKSAKSRAGPCFLLSMAVGVPITAQIPACHWR